MNTKTIGLVLLVTLFSFGSISCNNNKFRSDPAKAQKKPQKMGAPAIPQPVSVKPVIPETISVGSNQNPVPMPPSTVIENTTTLPKPEIIDETASTLKALPKFAMLANHWECGFCHMKLIGDMASTETVNPVQPNSLAVIDGDWGIRGKFKARAEGGKVTVNGTIKEDYDGTDVPKAIPKLDIPVAIAKSKGTLRANGPMGQVIIDKVKQGNTVIIGTETDPIVIDGDVVINGDLIILGTYTGIGTIYASGNIFLPADLKAQKSIFPYPDSRDMAIKKAEAAGRSFDGLGLATPKTAFVGSLHLVDHQVWTAKITSPSNNFPKALATNRLEFKKMYQWYGKDKYLQLHQKGIPCVPGSPGFSLNLIDSFIHAESSIEGHIEGSSFSIRGGIITDSFNIVNAIQCSSQVPAPLHGREKSFSYIEYDWRLGTGKFPILERVGELLLAQ